MADVGWKQWQKIIGVIPFDRDVLFFWFLERQFCNEGFVGD